MHLFRTAFGSQSVPLTTLALWLPLGITLLIVGLGILVFKREEKYFDDWM
jgi:ABC-type polysaccharide/polyol phosphate export permease